jgi:predicted DNA-binding transcriptional regulator YafY
MRASRLLSILMLLQLRGRVSAAALARELEVTVRTVYRDVEQLSAAGVPIYATRGRDGGFALLAGYQTRLTGLDAGEADLIGLMDVADAARALGFDREPADLRHKLLASLPVAQGAAAARIAARFHLDPSPWYGHRPAPSCLQSLAAAVWTDREVDIEYESWKGTVRRRVLPLGLVAKAGDWYCLALSAGDVRIYKVAAIRELDVSEREGRRPPAFDLAARWAERVADFERSLHDHLARVRLSADGLRLLRDLHPLAFQHAAARMSAADAAGWVETEVPLESGRHGVRELLRYGAEIEVLAPATLRQALASEAARVHAQHVGGSGAARRRRRA